MIYANMEGDLNMDYQHYSELFGVIRSYSDNEGGNVSYLCSAKRKGSASSHARRETLSFDRISSRFHKEAVHILRTSSLFWKEALQILRDSSQFCKEVLRNSRASPWVHEEALHKNSNISKD